MPSFALDASQQFNLIKMQVEPQEAEIKTDPNSLFIHNLDYKLDTQAVYEKFSEFGIVKNWVMPYMHGKAKGYGWISFENEQDAAKAHDSQKDIVLGTRQIFINVSLNFNLNTFQFARKDKHGKTDPSREGQEDHAAQPQDQGDRIHPERGIATGYQNKGY